MHNSDFITNLASDESTRLHECEAVIERGLNTFVEVGAALLEIRDSRLYRAEFGTFEAYCEQRWGMVASRARQLIGAAKTVNNLSGVTMVTPENERTARELSRLEPDAQRQVWQRAVETAPDGRITAAHVRETVETFRVETEARPSGVPKALQMSVSNEWYTPARYVESARRVMGGIDLDPASNPMANRVIQATEYYTQQSDGLAQSWHGRVWLNPPYGRDDGESNQARWSARLLAEYEAGNVIEAVLLVNAVTDREWFQPLWNYPICFTDHRIRFYDENGEAGQPTHGNALVYLGKNVDAFICEFVAHGVVVPKAIRQ